MNRRTVTLGVMTLSRRQSLVSLGGFVIAGGSVAVLSGCNTSMPIKNDPHTSTEAPPCAVQHQHTMDDWGGLRVHYVADCTDRDPTEAGEGDQLTRYFPDFALYLLSDDHQAESTAPINGNHQFYRSADQLVDGEVMDWDDGATITYARHRYSEFTNSRTDHADYYAFISFDRPPLTGRSVLTVRWRQVAWDAPAPERDLRTIARSVQLV